jgi:hypothetical protein
MNYALWNLNFINPNYGTGPEQTISELGFAAEGAWSDGQVQNGATIMGYVTEPQDETKLVAWNFRNITEQQALDFCLKLNAEAYLLPDGRITTPVELPE